MARRTQPVEIVVTVRPLSAADAEVSAATAVVDALLDADTLRRRGLQLVAVEGIEPCDAATAVPLGMECCDGHAGPGTRAAVERGSR